MKNVEDIYPLTPAQAGMLFHCLNEEQSGQYIIQFSCSIQGDFNREAFQSVWENVVQHYPVLRSAFVWENIEEPLQVVRQKVSLNWKIEDLQKNPDIDFKQEIQDYLKSERYKKNELAQAPLMRFALFQTDKNDWQFCWTCHHLLIDGWSMHMILKNIFDGYEILVKNESLALESSPPFSTYISWLQSQNQNDAKVYWQKTLANFDTPTPLNVISRKTNDTGSGTFIGQLSKEETSLLKQFAKDNRLTLNTLVQGAWALLLSRYNNQKDILFGTTVSGRPADLPGVELMAGMCINTLPVRIKIPANTDVIIWLTDIQTNLLELKNYEYSSLVDVHGWSEIPRTKTMFDSIVVFENYPLEKTKAKSSIEISNRQYIEKSNFPLAILAIPDEALQFMIIYDCSQFSTASMSDLTGRLNSILANFIKYSSKPIEKISVLGDAEEQKIISREQIKLSSKPGIDYVHQLLEKQAALTPQKAAVFYNDESLTYQHLNQRANQLAHYLISLNIKKNQPVGIYLERSLEMIVAILAVIKSGAAYLPLDSAYPSKRIDYMIDDAQCPIIITEDHLSGKLAGYKRRLIILNEEELSKKSSKNPEVKISADQLLYIIYTSGSTGNPKGVMVSHRNLQNSLNARFDYYKTQVEKYLLLPSFSFDSSVAGIFWTLCQGGALVIPDQQKHNDPEYLSELIATNQVTHLLGIPSLYLHLIENYADKLKSLKTAIVAGEACSKKVIELHKKEMPASRLYNEYGPTEATVWSSVFDCLSNYSAQSVPIGKPIPGGEIYIMDDQLNLLPDNIVGEIYLGGESISKGYLNQPSLTAEKFIANPFGTSNKTMLYKTGDMARRLPDGNIEFVGRNDQQVKLRGYRIEIGEIEAVLNSSPGVDEAAALVKSYSPGQTKQMSTESMAEHLAKLDSVEAEKILNEISNIDEDQARRILSANKGDDSNMVTRKIEDENVSINLQLKKDSFISPPRDAQRQWLVSQFINEFQDDLNHLDKVAKKFVAGTTAEVEFDITSSEMSNNRIMENWQVPIMKAMAQKVTQNYGDVLEIGFGRGVSAGFIQDFGVKSHTIVEMNAQCINDHFEPWVKKYPGKNIRLVEGRWQDALDKLGTYDGLFFHAFPMNEKEFLEYVVESITFAEHFFPVAAKLLNKGGVFTYLTTEIDSLSRRHQRALFKYFSEISLSVQPVKIPENTIDTWWADKMVIIKATKN